MNICVCVYIHIYVYPIYTYLGRHMLIDYCIFVYCIFVGTSCSLYISHKTKCAQGYHSLFSNGKVKTPKPRTFILYYMSASILFINLDFTI